jgi:hypothetical protein
MFVKFVLMVLEDHNRLYRMIHSHGQNFKMTYHDETGKGYLYCKISAKSKYTLLCNVQHRT